MKTLEIGSKRLFSFWWSFSYYKKVSNLLTIEDIKSQICFTKKYLLKQGQPIGKNYFKLVKNQFLADVLDRLTPTKATFNGNNSSAWKSDIIKANGFDERMEYGGLDCERI